MGKWIIVLTVCVAMGLQGACQTRDAVKYKHKEDTEKDKMLEDVFSGIIKNNGRDEAAELHLMHKRYYDLGGVVLQEATKGSTKGKETKGEWTVLKGSAKDENATVVELDAPNRVLYFLRRRDGNLRQLDSSLRELNPEKNYILSKISENDASSVLGMAMEKLAGTYKGYMPGNDNGPSEVELTLSVESGTYLFSRGRGGLKGDNKTKKEKGAWRLEKKRIGVDHNSPIIILESEKPGSERFFYVNKDNSLIEVNENLQPIKASFDQTLRKQ